MSDPTAAAADLAPGAMAGQAPGGPGEKPRSLGQDAWEDLRRNRENGWALFGLLQALRAQNKTVDASLTEARFKKAWARADITLPASRFARR